MIRLRRYLCFRRKYPAQARNHQRSRNEPFNTTNFGTPHFELRFRSRIFVRVAPCPTLVKVLLAVCRGHALVQQKGAPYPFNQIAA
jgi:hypothetical protein